MDHQPAITSGDLRVVSYLPLSHIAAQIVDIHSPMAGLLLGLKAEVHFARPDALKGSLKQTLIDAKPTVFFAVPRVWEKFAEAMQAAGKKTKWPVSSSRSGPRASVVRCRRQVGSKQNPFLGIARKLLSKAKADIGLQECRVFLSRGAHHETRSTISVPSPSTSWRCTACPRTPARRRRWPVLPGGHLRPHPSGVESRSTRSLPDKPGEGEVLPRPHV